MGKILVVDDEESIRITLSAFLTKAKHDVQVAEDADKAIELFTKTDFDVVVSDIILPRMTGVDLLKAIRKISPYVQVIMMTGRPTVETASESLRAGAFDYLYKPIRKDAILKTVRNALKVKILEDQNLKHQEELEHLVEERTRSLRESENRYRQLVHHSPDGIALQREDKLIFANHSMNKILERISDDLFEKTISDRTISDLRQEVSSESATDITNEKNITRFEETFTGKDNDPIHLDIVTLPMTLEGKPAIQVIARDITKQKFLERSLRQSQKMEAIGTLAGGIAHDFNNILFSIIGYSELSFDELEENSPVRKNLHEILEASKRATDLVRQILTFSRQTEHELSPVQIDLIVKETLTLLRASLPTTIEIRKKIETNAMALSDPTQIHQILMNLCVNASHAMREKGGVLAIDLESVEIDTNSSGKYPDLKAGPYINMSVCDTGHGIAPEVLNHIFDPFFTTKTREYGTGLGLSVIHGIVKNFGGVIYAFSEPGKGSIFKVFIPAIERRISPEQRTNTPIPKGTEHILFVDDEPALAKMGKQLLESLGYQVEMITKSSDALELFRKKPDRFDLVITDMTMPNITGEKLAIELMNIRPDIPVILSSGFNYNIDEKKAMALGIRAFISKPVLKQEIAETIRNVLDGKQNVKARHRVALDSRTMNPGGMDLPQ
ncbi:MAG: response regulator [Deltaproteobacteria bacterium]|nr:response regulator [Deltaproteobacteria bacterium]